MIFIILGLIMGYVFIGACVGGLVYRHYIWDYDYGEPNRRSSISFNDDWKPPVFGCFWPSMPFVLVAWIVFKAIGNSTPTYVKIYRRQKEQERYLKELEQNLDERQRTY